MAWPILDELDNRPDWSWDDYDLDKNGRIDSLVLIHSGYGAETTTDDCYGRQFTDRIWAHAFSSSRNAWKSKDGSMRVSGYTVASAFHGDCGSEPGKIGLTVHEYMHTLGLEDLYDGVDALAASGVGAFDIMAYPYGQTDDADIPGHLSVWSKVLAEWAEPIVITQPGDFTLKAAEISDEAYRINLSGEDEEHAEYLLIENRQPLEFDINIWSEGLVIYHVDDAAMLQMNLGYPGQPGWPENGNHYQVAVLPKDGNYDLEKGVNSGDAGDFWQPGDVLGPGFSNTIFPNTDRYQGGNIIETGLSIEVLSQVGTDVTFQIRFDGQQDFSTPESATRTPTPTIPAVTSPAPVTSAPTSPTSTPGVPSIQPPTLPYLEQFGGFGRQPSEPSYLSGFGPYPPESSYLSNFDSVTELQKSEQNNAEGFISMSFDTLTSLGVSANRKASHEKYGIYANAKKKKAPERNAEDDRKTLGRNFRGSVFVAYGTFNSDPPSAAPSWKNQSFFLNFTLCVSSIAFISISFL
jgi:M6 family metalloprotease-like protein